MTVTVTATVAADANGAIVNTASVVADGMVESETAEASASPLANVVRGDVYVDTNHNGVKDPGEPDLSGVTVTLIGPGTDGIFGTADDVLLDSTVTASPFQFADVGAGSFRIAVVTSTLPKGYRATGDNDGDTDSRVDVALAAGHSRTDLEFGYVPPTVDATKATTNDAATTDDGVAAVHRRRSVPSGHDRVRRAGDRRVPVALAHPPLRLTALQRGSSTRIGITRSVFVWYSS